MKLYKHYKGRYYRLKGYVRHSETLEEMALYDCLYENELGRTWVRPRDLFHGLHEGRSRFSEVSLEVEAFDQIQAAEIARIEGLSAQIFNNDRERDMTARIQGRRAYLQVAKFEGETAGFKFGYALDDEVFYSWLGGVFPAFRGLGVAYELMRSQHAWCRTQRFRKVQTKTQTGYHEMLKLNLRNGFKIIGTENQGEQLKVLFEKKL